MNVLTEAHKHFLIDLIKSETQFLLIGGYAVNYHGYPRYTSDLDIWLKPCNQNKEKFIQFLKLKAFNDENVAHIRSLTLKMHNLFFSVLRTIA